MSPLCIDLYCGLGGWADAFLSEGWRVIGFDIERHDYGTGGYPGQLVLQDIRTLHGTQLRDADLIVASPPCQEFSYRAMPWKRAKALGPPVLGIELFWQCWRIQHEASEAAGRDIPLIVENVRGAQKWVGRAAWNFGSFYLWGDVPALMPRRSQELKCNPDGTKHGQGSWFKIADSKNRGARTSVQDGRKVRMNFHEYEKTGKPGRSFQSVAVRQRDPMAASSGATRKAASAQIAKIPYPLASHIAQTFKPQFVEAHQ